MAMRDRRFWHPADHNYALPMFAITDARLLLETDGRIPEEEQKSKGCLKQVPEGESCKGGDKGDILTDAGSGNATGSPEDEALSLEEKIAP